MKKYNLQSPPLGGAIVALKKGNLYVKTEKNNK